MSTIINTRSPYFIKLSPATDEELEDAQLNLYIYDGVFGTDKPASPQYVIEKLPLVADLNNYISFEISELIRDYLYTEYYNESVDAVWVEADINYTETTVPLSVSYDYLAIDGYGYFEEGINPRESNDPASDSYTPQVLMDNTTIYFVKGQDIVLPIFSEPNPVVTFVTSGGSNTYWELTDHYWDQFDVTWGSIVSNINVVDSTDSADKIQYIVITGTEDLATGDTITVQSTTGTSQTTILTLKEICEPRYNPNRVIFYNKYGALQDIYFNKKSIVKTSTQSEDYNSSTISFTGAPSYNITKHTKKRFNVTANESITLNTGFLIEQMNDPIKQLLMSEQVWLNDGTNVLPVIIKTSSLQEKTSVNDKLIQYSIDFDFAFNKINNVR